MLNARSVLIKCEVDCCYPLPNANTKLIAAISFLFASEKDTNNNQLHMCVNTERANVNLMALVNLSKHSS